MQLILPRGGSTEAGGGGESIVIMVYKKNKKYRGADGNGSLYGSQRELSQSILDNCKAL